MSSKKNEVSVEHSTINESEAVKGSASGSSKEAAQAKAPKKRPVADAASKARPHQFIKTNTGLISNDSVSGVVVIDAPTKKAVALYDEKGLLSGWCDFESHDAAVSEFNAIVDQMGVSDDMLCIQDCCSIPFSFIKGVSDRTTDKGRFLVIDGYHGRALIMFDSKDLDIDQLKKAITEILTGETDNEKITFED